jgi:hypothetical protein
MTGLSVDPSNRYTTAEEMAEHLLRVITPSFAPPVGRWVEEVAHEPLARRVAIVAEIESYSGVVPAMPMPASQAVVAAASTPRPAQPVATAADPPTTVTQTSSLSLETPKPVVPPGRPLLGTRLTLAAGALGVVAVATFAVVTMRPSRRPPIVESSVAPAVSSVASPGAPSTDPLGTAPSASASTDPASSLPAASMASPAPSAHPVRKPRRRPSGPSPATDPASFR